VQKILDLTIGAEPVPKGRPRFLPNGIPYTPRKTREAEKDLRWAARVKMDRLGNVYLPREPTYKVRLQFFCSDRRRRDIDNLEKLVLDALEGVVWRNDSQIEDLYSTVRRSCPEPKTCIEVYECIEVYGC